jgi:hypothetical protein
MPGESEFSGRRVSLDGYRWNTANASTLEEMRAVMTNNRWVNRDAYRTLSTLEEYFKFSDNHGHWQYPWEPPINNASIDVDGISMVPENMGNLGYVFEYYSELGVGIGVCADEAILVNGFMKSWGFATNIAGYLASADFGHGYSMVYNPDSELWQVYRKQLNVDIDMWPNHSVSFQVFKLPVNQVGYFQYRNLKQAPPYIESGSHFQMMTTMNGILAMFTPGVGSQTYESWMFGQ